MTETPFDPVLMFKIMVLQALHSLPDEATEFQIKDRLSFPPLQCRASSDLVAGNPER